MSNDKVLSDSQVAGGEGLRGVDRWLSSNLGGYNSGGEPSFYGRNIEPILHGLEHTRRSVCDGFNSQEWARAKDAFSTTGSGLHTMDNHYQNQNRG